MVSADYSATHPSQSVLFAPPTPPPELLFFFLLSLSRSLSRARAWRLGGMRNPKRSRPEAVLLRGGGKRGRGSKGVSARTTEAEDEDRRRPALGGVPIARFCKS